LVIDVNDNVPIFYPHVYNITIRIEDLTDEPILRCNALDADIGFFGQVIYDISIGNEADIFHINKSSGEIYIVRPNRLTRSTKYFLNITASDAAGVKTNFDALVQITTTSFGQKLGSCNKPRNVITIKENIPKNTLIGNIKDLTGMQYVN
jgi:protocadherin Fat 4